MKLLLFSDLHNDAKALAQLTKKAKTADAAVCAGDFTVFGRGMSKMLDAMQSWGIPVFIVPGNHEDEDEVREEIAKRSNLHNIHKKVHPFEGITFAGHGGEGFSEKSTDFESWKPALPKGKLVFVTHQPPFGTTLDYIWDHHGNKSYRSFITKKKPVLAVCGHLHETQGKEDKIGKTRVLNPGPKGMIVEV